MRRSFESRESGKNENERVRRRLCTLLLLLFLLSLPSRRPRLALFPRASESDTRGRERERETGREPSRSSRLRLRRPAGEKDRESRKKANETGGALDSLDVRSIVSSSRPPEDSPSFYRSSSLSVAMAKRGAGLREQVSRKKTAEGSCCRGRVLEATRCHQPSMPSTTTTTTSTTTTPIEPETVSWFSVSPAFHHRLVSIARAPFVLRLLCVFISSRPS